jgi:hypothetical protein
MTDLKKPITRRAKADVPHGVKSQIVITLYPGERGGTIGLREAGRRRSAEYFLDIGALYVRAVQNKIAYDRMNKGKKRAQERKLRRALR